MLTPRKGPRPDFDNITRTSRPTRPQPSSRGRQVDENGEEGSGSNAVEPPKRSAKLYAAWLLGRREYSAKELEQRLKQKGYEPAQIEECRSFLAKHELQSDKRYAESLVRSNARRLGNRRIQYDLASKGIDEVLASSAMACLDDETERARAAAKRFEGKLLTPALKAKAWRFLMARGFGSSATKAAVNGLGRTDSEGSDDRGDSSEFDACED